MRILFWGTPWFAVPGLRALGEEGHEVVGVVSQPDRPAGRGRRTRSSPVKELALAEGLPVLTPQRPRGLEFMDQLRALDPEISVVVAYGHILEREVLELPPRGSLNVHASLLPALRGAAPVHWAIARGHDLTGVTVMRMVEAMDAGPVLLQVEEPIGPYETSTELSTRLSELGAQALVEVLASLEIGASSEVEQDHELATYAPKVDREMARVDWSRPARAVADHVRAMDEVPGAWSPLDGGDPVKLFRPRTEPHGDGGAAAASVAIDDGAEPGTVVDAEPGSGRGLGVACSEGVVWIGEIQPPGKRRMPADDWLLGRGAAAGRRFG
jgi:methionyl-tRNA formyltransferase